MSIVNCCEKLNSFCLPNVKFFAGDSGKILDKLLSSITPYAKLLLLVKDNKAVANVVSNKLKKAGYRVQIFNVNSVELSVDNIKQLFTCDEDIRNIVCISEDLVPMASYFANVKRLNLYILPTSICAKTSLINDIYVKNGKVFDKIKINIKKYVIFDFSIIETSKLTLANGYAECLNYLSSLLEYKINLFFNGEKIDDNIYSGIKKTISAVLTNYQKDKYNYENLIEYTYTLAIYNSLLSNVLIYNNASFVSAFLYSGGKVDDIAFYTLYINSIITKFYQTWWNSEINTYPSIPSYLDKIETQKALLNIDLLFAKKTTELNSQLLNEKQPLFSTIKQYFKKDVQALSDNYDKLLKIYYQIISEKKDIKLNKIDGKRLLSSIKCSGYTFFGINGMTYLTEIGFTDIL